MSKKSDMNCNGSNSSVSGHCLDGAADRGADQCMANEADNEFRLDALIDYSCKGTDPSADILWLDDLDDLDWDELTRCETEMYTETYNEAAYMPVRCLMKNRKLFPAVEKTVRELIGYAREIDAGADVHMHPDENPTDLAVEIVMDMCKADKAGILVDMKKGAYAFEVMLREDGKTQIKATLHDVWVEIKC